MSGPGALSFHCTRCDAAPFKRCWGGEGARLADDCHEPRVRAAERASHAALVSALEGVLGLAMIVDGECARGRPFSSFAARDACDCVEHQQIEAARAALRAEGRR